MPPKFWVPLISRLRGGVDPILQTFASSYPKWFTQFTSLPSALPGATRWPGVIKPPCWGRRWKLVLQVWGRFEAGKVAGRTRNFWSLRRTQGFFVTGAFFFYFSTLKNGGKRSRSFFPLPLQTGGSILEVGTYCGYSALRMAMAVPHCRVVSLEVREIKKQKTRKNWGKGGIEKSSQR